MNPYEKLIVITDRRLCETDFLTQIRKVVRLQPRALILRERDLTDEEYMLLACEVREICRQAQVPFFVHARVPIAAEIGCGNIHLPLPVLAGLGGRPEGFECVSTTSHSMEDMQEAVSLGADRVILGTIFETACKKGLRGKGLSFVRDISQACPVPVYAIGGIKLSNIQSVIEAGAAGGCMMSGFMKM